MLSVVSDRNIKSGRVPVDGGSETFNTPPGQREERYTHNTAFHRRRQSYFSGRRSVRPGPVITAKWKRSRSDLVLAAVETRDKKKKAGQRSKTKSYRATRRVNVQHACPNNAPPSARLRRTRVVGVSPKDGKTATGPVPATKLKTLSRKCAKRGFCC